MYSTTSIMWIVIYFPTVDLWLVNKRLDEWVSEDRVDIDTLQPPKKEEKKLQGAAATKTGEQGPRKHAGGRKRKHSEAPGAASDASSAAGSASEAGSEVCFVHFALIACSLKLPMMRPILRR